MKSVRVHQYGGPEVLQVEDIPIPAPGAGQALVKVEISGVNFIDMYHRSGTYTGALPMTLGVEGCGVVTELGNGVNEVRVGDRVCYALVPAGSYAEYHVVPAARLVPVPAEISAAQAVAAMVQALTAHYLTISTHPIAAGETVLIHAAAGGTGALVVQAAKKRGARVLATVSTPEKAEIAKQAGADEVILYSQQDFEVEVKRLTDGKGVDVVYDSVGLTTFDKSLNCLRPRGLMVLYGQSSGVVPPFAIQTLNSKGSLFLTRPSLGAYTATRDELLWRAREVFEWITAGELTIRMDKQFPLAEAADAQRYLEGRESKGKVVLII